MPTTVCRPWLDGHAPETGKHFFAFKGGPGGVTREIAKHGQAAEPAGELDEVVAQGFVLQCGAKRFADAAGDDEFFAARLALAQQDRSGRESDDGQDALERLSQDFVRFSALQAGSGQIQVGERQHVAFDLGVLALVSGQDYQGSGTQEWERPAARQSRGWILPASR